MPNHSSTIETLKFIPVEASHAKILYKLLENRIFNISHKELPNYEDHLDFMFNNQYLQWYLIYSDNPIGTFYIQEDNSIGINLEIHSDNHVEQIIKFISEKFIPQKQKASKIPPYFYVNTPIRNEQMINSLDKCKLTAIQITHKLIQNGNI